MRELYIHILEMIFHCIYLNLGNRKKYLKWDKILFFKHGFILITKCIIAHCFNNRKKKIS